MMHSVWMLVTADKYELPILVADSAAELARLTHRSQQTIRGAVSRFENGKWERSRYQRVRITDDEEDD